MKHYQFSNIEITDQFISANVYKNNNYVMKIGAETLHLMYTEDIEDTLYKEFKEFALNHLNNSSFKEDNKPANIINMWDYVKKPAF